MPPACFAGIRRCRLIIPGRGGCGKIIASMAAHEPARAVATPLDWKSSRPTPDISYLALQLACLTLRVQPLPSVPMRPVARKHARSVACRSTAEPRPRGGMTLIEAVVTIFLLSVGLFLLTGWTGTVRAEAKRDLAVRMLTELDQALARYRRASGSYPSWRGSESDISAVVDLLDHDKTRPILEAFPRTLWRGPDRYRLVDPWGTPLRYYPPDSMDPKVLANENRPLFESAGPDRDFGDSVLAAIGDNLRSDDAGADGLRLHDALREAMTEAEDSEDADDEGGGIDDQPTSPDDRDEEAPERE